jgi:hypothetical protein
MQNMRTLRIPNHFTQAQNILSMLYSLYACFTQFTHFTHFTHCVMSSVHEAKCSDTAHISTPDFELRRSALTATDRYPPVA